MDDDIESYILVHERQNGSRQKTCNI